MLAYFKNSRIFATTYIHRGGSTAVKGGFFLSENYHGSVPPCNSVMELLPLWCKSTGKAEPFFIFQPKQNNFFLKMHYTEKNSFSVNDSTRNTTPYGAKTVLSEFQKFILFAFEHFGTGKDHMLVAQKVLQRKFSRYVGQEVSLPDVKIYLYSYCKQMGYTCFTNGVDTSGVFKVPQPYFFVLKNV